MKTETRELLGFNVPVVGIAETLSELIAAAGSEQVVINDCNNQTLAHSHYTILRKTIVTTLEKITGVKRLTEKQGEGDKAKEVVVEKDAAYIARLEEELGEDVLKSHEAAVAAECAKVKVDYTPGQRGEGSQQTPAKKWLAYYDQLLAEGKLDLFMQKHGIDATSDEETRKVTVANKVKDIVTAKMAEAARAAVEV